jgi:putative acetyltransferase
MSMVIRAETPEDVATIRAVNVAAFPSSAEADLVDRLRSDSDLILSLVAEQGGTIAGHVGFSRMGVDDDGMWHNAVALAPVAVHPAHQRTGIGKALIVHGLQALKEQGEILVFVLGSHGYYGRFGFDLTDAEPFACAYAGPHFQLLRLSDGGPLSGRVQYAAAFAALG